MKSNIIFKIVLLCLTSQLSRAFTLSAADSNLAGWDGANVQFFFNSANCPTNVDIPGAIQAAAKLWNSVPTSSLKVSYGGTTTSTTYSSPPTIYCSTNFTTATGLDQNYVGGAGSVLTSSSQIVSGLITLNASAGSANIGSYDTTTLLVMMTHEMGHVLGLGHSEKSYAMMYYSAGAKSTVTLSQDDMDGITYLYPRNELGADKMMGCGLVAVAGGGSSQGGAPKNQILWLVLLLATPLCLCVVLGNRGATPS